MGRIKTVAIIGGGVAGLSAAGLLSRKGVRVKLFEANEKLGGCCANTNLGGYTFHDGALYLALPGVIDHVFERLGLDRAALVPIRKVASQKTTLPDGSVVYIGDRFNVTATRPGGDVNRRKLEKELAGMLKRWEPVLRLFADDIMLHPFSMSRLVAKGWSHLHKFSGTVASEITGLFSDDAVRAAMTGGLLYTGAPPEKTPALSILGLVAMLTDGFYLPEGGMGRIPDALSLSLKNNGGEISLNSKIHKIIVTNGRVSGLEVEGQGVVEIDAVISTVTGMATFGSLMDPDHVPESMKRKVRTSPLSLKGIVVQLGLSNVIDVQSHTNNVIPMMSEQYKVFMPDEDDVRWPIYSVPTVTIPELAPPGGSIIEMFPPIQQEMSADEWDEDKKEKIVASAIRSLSRMHDIDVAVKRAQSPKDFQGRMHLYKGALYGLSPTADPRVQFEHKTEVPGLYLAGQTTFPGYGVGPAAMSGILAAETLLKTEHIA